jgi:hypothetical protein
MPALFPPQHERFAVELSLLKKPVEAYKLAGYVPDRGNARKLARKAHIQRRVRELQQQQAELAEIEGARILIEIARVGFSNQGNYRNSDGSLIPLRDLPPHLAAAVSHAEHDSEGNPIQYRLWDKNIAIVTLLKHVGGLPDDEPSRGDVNIFNVLSVEDQRALADALENVGGGPGAGHLPATGERSP